MTDPPDIPVTAGLPLGTLDGHIAVVTGAGQGIGRALAAAMLALGARVALAEISPAGAAAAAEINAAGGGTAALFVQTDVADAASVEALAETVQAAWGPPSILVNNAIATATASVVDLPVAEWDRVMAVNLRGTFLTCRAFVPGMLAQERGVVVNLVSTQAMPGLSAYIASKQGIAGFTQSLAAEVVGRGVSVAALDPGLVDTPGLRALAPGLAPRLGLSPEQFLSLSVHRAYPSLMPAEHAAAAAVYLIARLARDYHGEIANGYEVLERAGLLSAAVGGDALPAAPAAPPTSRSGNLGQAAALSRQLHAFLLETDSEFDKLPVFVRPMARGGFKSKVGLRVQDSIRAVSKLTEQLQRMQSSHSLVDIEFQVDQTRMADMLRRLQRYYGEMPAEAERFSADASLLSQIQRQAAQRQAVIESLLAALDGF